MDLVVKDKSVHAIGSRHSRVQCTHECCSSLAVVNGAAQQVISCGTHSSTLALTHLPGIPAAMPTLPDTAMHGCRLDATLHT